MRISEKSDIRESSGTLTVIFLWGADCWLFIHTLVGKYADVTSLAYYDYYQMRNSDE